MATNDQHFPEPAAGAPEPFAMRPGMRHLMIAFGWLCVALGMIGVVVPGLPTTIFLIMALWAFSKSSRRFHDWLYNHSRFGPPLRRWTAHRVIPLQAKMLAVSMMAASWALIAFAIADNWILPTAVGVVMLSVAAYIVTRPSRVGG